MRTLVNSESWHIENQRHIQNLSISKKTGTFRTRDIFRIVGYSEPETYPELCQISTMERFEKQLTATIIFTSNNYFRNISFIQFKNVLGAESRGRGPWIWYTSSKFYSDIIYYFWLSTFSNLRDHNPFRIELILWNFLCK